MTTEDRLYNIGEQFGDAIANLVRTLRAYVVTVDRVREDKGVAEVSLFEGQTIIVPLSSIGLASGMLRITPNVGSLAIIQYPNGNEAEPIFIAYEAVDRIEIARGKTSFVWSITPPKRDQKGDEIEGETNDELTLTVDTSSIRVAKDIIELNGGTLGDLVVIGKLTERLNKLQSEIDRVQANIVSHSHMYIDSKGAAATPTPSRTTSTEYTRATFTQVKNEDYNNEKITQ